MYYFNRFTDIEIGSYVFPLIRGNSSDAATLVNTELVQWIKWLVLADYRDIGAMDSGDGWKLSGHYFTGQKYAQGMWNRIVGMDDIQFILFDNFNNFCGQGKGIERV